MPRTLALPIPSRTRRLTILASAAIAVLAACGGGSDDEAESPDATTSAAVEDTGADATPAAATSDDKPGGDVPVAPINNPEIDDPEAEGTMRAAMQPGDWFEFEYGFSARIESVRAAQAGEIATEAQGGGASIINVQVHYDGDDPSSAYTFFQLDTEMFNQAECVDKGPGYFDVAIDKGTTINVPFCVHLEPGGYNAVTLFSYPASSQSWGAIYAIEAPDGVIEPQAPAPSSTEAPGF